jgi:hypothetical protein
MSKKHTFTKILAIAGTTLAWLPILAPLFFAIGSLIMDGRFRFDYLMPAEVFPVALAGALMLLWAALRKKAYRRLIAWSLGSAIVMLFGGQAIAVVTGLASGATEPTGWRFALVLGMIAAYDLALVAIGIGGILLLVKLYKRTPEQEIELPKKDGG